MKFVLLPWKPELVFTGTSVMGINAHNMKLCTHVDSWDSIQNNDHFSIEGFLDMVKQVWSHRVFALLRVYKTPDVETPRYRILKRTANYELSKQVVTSCLCLPALNEAEVSLRKVEEGIAAVLKFSGKADEEIFRDKEKSLRQNLAALELFEICKRVSDSVLFRVESAGLEEE
ncbi:hypothetical protein SASPL_112703 [Salvia splendens]|uniref:Uncharacterized protein n=1 Tax=Salvia splendens TaxID=180675 RepID=A0A8X8Y9A2_SALSN|nr:hypothetical protein SASPL_112703 [Salvia splendens]